MATITDTTDDTGVRSGNWRAGVLGGIGGALVMGALVLAMNPPTLAVAIPSLYGLAPPPNPGLGMVVHVSHGAVLGVVFAALVGAAAVEEPVRIVGLGIAWGVATWIGLAALLMPLWLGAVGSPASPPFPNFAPPSLLWHVVYGAVLGAVYVATEGV
ncbi:histidine kinase [Haloplanus halophilus]|uniref:histidine kinase n=1 Tax=Haloplanus halophilus TaxID=2949993 RepID=UPI00203CFB73|nr:histidine kinase [Haloplanus sp. GDY1]